jgi:hypothetical protein
VLASRTSCARDAWQGEEEAGARADGDRQDFG